MNKDGKITKILFYIGHPAQYHFFKNIILKLHEDDIKTKILIKTKDILEELLLEDNVEYVNIQEKIRGNSKLDILLSSFKRTIRVYKESKKFGAQLLIGTDSSVAQAAWLLKQPALTVLEDDVEIIYNLARLTYPFTSCIVVPSVCRVGKWESKKISYQGYMKLAYLHPDYFKSDDFVLKKYGINNKYILIRLAKLTAHHDKGIKGLTNDLVGQIISIAENLGFNVYISVEGIPDDNLKQYCLKIQKTDIHHIMAFSSLLISDSQSMSVEAAMLGIPSLRFSDFSGKISVLEELNDKYNLTYGIKTSDSDQLLEMTGKLLSNKQLSHIYQQHRYDMLSEKIDVTKFFVWFVENFPNSKSIVKSDPDYVMRIFRNKKYDNGNSFK